MLTAYFPGGALIRFAAKFTRPPSVAEIAAAVPALLERGGEVMTAAPMDGDKVFVDPTTLRLRVLNPSAVESDYLYESDPEVVRDGVGTFHADIPDAANVAGAWRYRWEGTGAGQAVAEASYTVKASAFPP